MVYDMVNRSVEVGSRTPEGGCLEADRTVTVDYIITFPRWRTDSYRQAQGSPSSLHKLPFHGTRL